MSKYLELWSKSFDETINEKTKVENKPYVAYSLVDGKVVYTMVPKPVAGPADNEIWYTSVDGNVITPSDTNAFGANIVSNTYENGKGIIAFDGSVTGIDRAAFRRCYSLSSIVIPDSVIRIGEMTFYDCSSLISVTIPSSIMGLGDGVFSGCSLLSSITFEGTIEQWNVMGKIDGWNGRCSEITVHCTDGDITIPANN